MTDNTFFVVHSFMTKELNLSGNELLVYAIIFGFSQDGKSKYCGSLKYMADSLNTSVSTIQRALNALAERELIDREEKSGKISYMVKMNTEVVKMTTPMVKMTNNNNIYNNTKNNKKEPRMNLYEKCSAIVYEKFTDTDVIEAMLKYLSVRIKVGLTEKQWRDISEELFTIATTKEEALSAIDKAYKGGYRKLYADSSRKKKEFVDTIIKTEKTEDGKLKDIYREEFSMTLLKDRPPFEEWKQKYLTEKGEQENA